jgi:hypothetical protein
VKAWLAPAHLALTLVIIIWNVLVAGRIAQLRQASPPFAALTGIAGLLMIPASLVVVATTTVIPGRAIASIDWLWPLAVVLCAAQSIWALSRRLVNPLWGFPIAFYNVLLMIAALTRFAAAHGVDVARPLLVMMAAEVDTLALATTEAAIMSPFFFHVPMISPAFPAINRLTAGFRVGIASLALVWLGLMVAAVPRADVALDSYDDHAKDRLTERPTGFSIGLKLFPDISKPPATAAARADVDAAVQVAANVVNVVFVPGASTLAVDSVTRAIGALPRDSLFVIATIGYGDKLLPELGRVSFDSEARLATLRRVLERMRPDMVIPAQDPYGLGARILGRLPVETWIDYHTRAAALVEQVRPRTLVGLTASSFDARDSALYAWAATPGSPIEVLGFSFAPTRLGARSMDAGFRAADRWLRVHPPRKPHWVLSAGGYPLAHGEISQARAIWAALSWATERPAVQGLVVHEAADYGQAMGIRSPGGRFRRAAGTLATGVRILRETFVMPVAPGAAPAAPAATARR